MNTSIRSARYTYLYAGSDRRSIAVQVVFAGCYSDPHFVDGRRSNSVKISDEMTHPVGSQYCSTCGRTATARARVNELSVVNIYDVFTCPQVSEIGNQAGRRTCSSLAVRGTRAGPWVDLLGRLTNRSNRSTAAATGKHAALMAGCGGWFSGSMPCPPRWP